MVRSLICLGLLFLAGCGPSEPKGSIKSQNHDDKPRPPSKKTEAPASDK